MSSKTNRSVIEDDPSDHEIGNNPLVGEDADDDAASSLVDKEITDDVGIRLDSEDAPCGTVQAPKRWRCAPKQLAAIAGAVMIAALGGVVGWLALELQRSQHASDQRIEFLQAARQGAENLTRDCPQFG